MSRLKWFIAGVGLGIVALKQINENPKARKALDDAIATAKEFSTAVADGFIERETELKKPATKSPTAKAAPKKTAARKPATKSNKSKPANK